MEFLSTLSTKEKRKLLKKIQVIDFCLYLHVIHNKANELDSETMTLQDMYDFVSAERFSKRSSKRRKLDSEVGSAS